MYAYANKKITTHLNVVVECSRMLDYNQQNSNSEFLLAVKFAG